MSEIIAVTNQKGGVGKSTTAHQIAAYTAEMGYKTLLIDTDGQANVTLIYGKKNKGLTSLYDVMDDRKKAPIQEAITPVKENLDLIPAASDLNIVTLPKIGTHTVLKKALTPIMGQYDYIVIDTPPALGDMLINVLAVASKVVVPAQADLFSLDAIKELADTIAATKEELNPSLKVEGVLLTRYQSRAIVTREITESIEDAVKDLNTKLFNTKIRECVAIKESVILHKDIFEYDRASNGAIDYKNFCTELFSIN